MENLIIKKTDRTPEVSIDCKKGSIIISGICIPEDPVIFFNPIEKKIDCINRSNTQIVFDIYLEYFNTAASKSLLRLLIKVAKLNDVETPSKVLWKLEEGDDELRESGEILKEISELDFEFIELPTH